MVNSCTLIGRTGEVVKMSLTAGDNPVQVARFCMATDEYYKKSDGTLVKNTDWHHVVFKGPKAGICEKLLKEKGKLIYIEGALKTREYKNKEGEKKKITEIKGRDIKILEKKKQEDDDADFDPQDE